MLIKERGGLFVRYEEHKMICPDCQRTVLALRNLDKVVNGQCLRY